MADTALIVANNLSHNVSVRIEEAKTSPHSIGFSGSEFHGRTDSRPTSGFAG
jgi:hypothetical protein